MEVTHPGTLPRRGTSCDRREAVFRSRAYTPGSTDRRRVAASVKRASAKRGEGWVWRDRLRSHKGYRFWRPKVCSTDVDFFRLPVLCWFARSRALLRGAQVRPGIHRGIQDNAEQSRALQGNTGGCSTIQDGPRGSRNEPVKTESSRRIQENAEMHRINPGIQRNLQGG